MAGLGATFTFIYLIIFLVLLMLGILLPFFVYRIYQESIKTNKLLQQVISCLLDPEKASKAIQNPERTRQLQQSYRGRNNHRAASNKVKSKIVKTKVNDKNKSEKIALCSCGKRFSYPLKNVGSKECCPECKSEFLDGYFRLTDIAIINTIRRG